MILVNMGGAMALFGITAKRCLTSQSCYGKWMSALALTSTQLPMYVYIQ